MVDQTLQIVIEMAESIGDGLRRDLAGITEEEVNWRPVPGANSINLIVRHLAIEAEWHRDSLELGEPMPHDVSDELQRRIDAIPMDFESNLAALDEAYRRFVAALRNMTQEELQVRTAAAYHAWPSCPTHFLGFHQAMHIAMHWGQIRTIRNLYKTTRGETARFYPENPTFPKTP